MRFSLPPLLLVLLVTACAAEIPTELDDRDKLERANGPDPVCTTAPPAVGRLCLDGGGCGTGTLIAPDTVLTAAHVVGNATQSTPGNYGTFTIERSGHPDVNVGIALYRGDWRRWSDADPDLEWRTDLALVRLTHSVPADVATPFRIAHRTPDPTETVHLVGYGQNPGVDCKRIAVVVYGRAADVVSPGDSGGPVLIADGSRFDAVSRLMVASPRAACTGSFEAGCYDRYANAAEYRGELEAQAAAWDAQYGDAPPLWSEPEPDPEEPMKPVEPPMAPPSSSPDACRLDGALASLCRDTVGGTCVGTACECGDGRRFELSAGDLLSPPSCH